MNANQRYIEINQSSWKRQDYFYYFTKMNPTAYSVTVQMDVTKLYQFIKQNDYKFFPSYLFIVSKIVSAHSEFKLATMGEQLVEYEVLHPSYSLFHDDDQSISMMWTNFETSFPKFYENYLEDQKLYGDKKGAVVKEETPPMNTYMVGMIPWLEFTNYTPLPLENLANFFPIVQGGKMQVIKGNRFLPLSFTIHHAAADGYHVSKFFEELQAAFNRPELWLK
ncbi:chloramphenicol O-acetyltransferase type A [Enterococcus sp. AZ194]|uniref:chloramphenicol acetyltransferase n=1 Tax=Enterococcus sp. AZ194 TaxID=2774629 RepID=UPI003F26F3BF